MPPKKKLTGVIKLQIKAGAATPAPPVGPALGQHGVNIMEFCKQYNAATESQRGDIVPVEISVFEDRSFTFVTKTPPAARMILKAAGVDKGSPSRTPRRSRPSRTAQVREIATTKMADLNANDLDAGREDHRRHRPLDGHHRHRLATPARPRTTCGRARTVRARRPRPARPGAEEHPVKRSKAYRGRGREDRPRPHLLAPRGRPPRQGHEHRQVRRDRRGRHAPRRRPAQGRPDGPRHGQPAARHRQDRPRHRLRARATRPPRPTPPAPTSSAPTT